jgi:radical SAM superfamily enzyme YgiQ (UPF0313 family)
MTLAALTPAKYEVSILDEHVDSIDFDEKVDLVGITAMTNQATRAYEIATEYRRRGVKTVLGGMHASSLPEEALQYADSIVVGEAEYTWPQLLDDFGAGRMKDRYTCSTLHDLKNMVLARRDLLLPKHYFTFNVMQTSRGCPHQCSFCSVSTFSGRKYRYRPTEEVVEEVKYLKSLGNGRFMLFLDDNIIGNFPRAKELFEALIPLKIYWASQATISVAKDRELLDLAARSGCKALYVGLESVSSHTLEDMGKKLNNPQEYAAFIDAIHDYRIAIIGSFVVGTDTDDITTFKKTSDFINNTKLDSAYFHVLTPLPGTRLYDQFKSENRLLGLGWDEIWGQVSFRPKNMSGEELRDGIRKLDKSVYSVRSILRRIDFGKWGRYSILIFALNIASRYLHNIYYTNGKRMRIFDKLMKKYTHHREFRFNKGRSTA